MPPSVDLSRATQGRWVDAAIYEMASSQLSPQPVARSNCPHARRQFGVMLRAS